MIIMDIVVDNSLNIVFFLQTDVSPDYISSMSLVTDLTIISKSYFVYFFIEYSALNLI